MYHSFDSTLRRVPYYLNVSLCRNHIIFVIFLYYFYFLRCIVELYSIKHALTILSIRHPARDTLHYMSLCFHSRFARCAESNTELNFHNVQLFLDECLKSFIDNCLPLKPSTPIKPENLSRKDLTSFPICSIFFLSRTATKEFILKSRIMNRYFAYDCVNEK